MSPTRDAATAERLVRLAMDLAGKAADRGDPPFGAVLADATGRVLAKASNRQVTPNDPTAHAAITLIRVAARTLERCFAHRDNRHARYVRSPRLDQVHHEDVRYEVD